MSESITLTLPMPPSSNRYWRTVVNKKTGHAMTFVSEEAKAFKRDVKTMARWRPFLSEVVITLRVFRERRSGDLDNRLKVTLDALQGVAYVNDGQIVEIHAYRFDDKQNPRVEVEVTALGLC